MLEFFGLESWSTGLGSLLFGSALGFLFGFIPGLGGRLGIILCLPLATFFPPYEAAIFLFSMHAVVNTSGAIPNIAFGIPSSAGDMATIIDGYPLAKMGRAGEALGASLSASAIGGMLGAVAFLAAIPVARPLVTSFGPPEFLLLAIFGMTMVASLSREGLFTGLVVGALGIIVSIIGQDHRAGSSRFTFGIIELWDGVGLAAIVCGLFVVPEMLSLTALDKESHDRATSTTIRDVYRGMFVTFRHMRIVLRSTLYGILIGLTPSVGSTISIWMSYDYAARTTKSDIPFGQGAIAGVIAPEAANNSKEGGAMIPTLFFGIPGSSSMAIMMGALAFAGVAVGPHLLSKDIGLSYSLAAAVFLANLVVVPIFFLVIPTLVRLSSIRREAIVPLAIVISVTAALIDTPDLLTIILIGVGSVLGIALKLADWPRAPFILGYVIGGFAEQSYFHTSQLYGWAAFLRPMTIFLTLLTIGWLIHVIRSRPVTHIGGPRGANIAVSLGLAIVLAGVIATAFLTIDGAGKIVPVSVATGALVLCLVVFSLALASKECVPMEPMRHALPFGIYLLLTPIAGQILSGAVFILTYLRLIGISLRTALIATAVFSAFQFLILESIFDIVVEREFVGRIAWAILAF